MVKRIRWFFEGKPKCKKIYVTKIVGGGFQCVGLYSVFDALLNPYKTSHTHVKVSIILQL